MKLKILNIIFQEPQDFFSSLNSVLKMGLGQNDKNILRFDSVKTFNSVMTVKKIQILRAISQKKPESIYQLASFLNREPNHVLKDCRLLESYKFIKLQKTNSNRGSIRPVLSFHYDVIKTNSSTISPYTISEKSEQILFGHFSVD